MRTTTIPLTHGQNAIVDAADYSALSAYPWRAMRSPSGGFYAVRTERDGSGRDSWGPWIYSARLKTLTGRGQRGQWEYEIDLAQCLSHWDIVDWLAQLNGKAWLSEEGLGWLVRALNDIVELRSPRLGA